MDVLNWAMIWDVDTTAIAHYCHYWRGVSTHPQWTLAFALLVVLSMNPDSVRLFGELEFWALLIKVIALVTLDRRYGLSLGARSRPETESPCGAAMEASKPTVCCP